MSNVDYRLGSRKSKFDMTIISDSPFKGHIGPLLYHGDLRSYGQLLSLLK